MLCVCVLFYDCMYVRDAGRSGPDLTLGKTSSMRAAETGNKSACIQVRRADDTVGNPHRAQICQFEFFELFLLFNVDNHLSIEQFELTAS